MSRSRTVTRAIAQREHLLPRRALVVAAAPDRRTLTTTAGRACDSLFIRCGLGGDSAAWYASNTSSSLSDLSRRENLASGRARLGMVRPLLCALRAAARRGLFRQEASGRSEIDGVEV
eukprot:4005673-Prymnesium_polylepis.2